MKKVQIQEGLHKMKEGAKDALVHGNKPLEAVGTVMQERKEKKRQEMMLQIFEEEVIVKQERPKYNPPLPKSRS
jgi:hypothetical protein